MVSFEGFASTFQMTDTDFNYGHNEEAAQHECGATIECRHCNTFFGYCSDIQKQIRGEQMLPKSDAPSSAAPRRRSGGMTYLTNEMLSTKTPKSARILAVKLEEENRYGPRIVLKLAFEGNTIFWGVNIKKNPNYKLLEKQFGNEEDDWVSNDIELQLVPDKFTDGHFIHVSFPDKKRGAR